MPPMRVVLVGTPADRATLRARLNASMEVVGEFPTLGAARAAGTELDGVDGILVAPHHHDTDAHGNMAPEDAAAEPLTPREIDVLELLAEGLPNKAIARRLGISDQTVKFHVASISGEARCE